MPNRWRSLTLVAGTSLLFVVFLVWMNLQLGRREAHADDSLGIVLDRLTGSFLTEEPDLPGLDDIIRHLASLAVIPPESLLQARDGSVHGQVVLRGSQITGAFALTDGDYRIAFETPLTHSSALQLVKREIVVSFREELGKAAGVTTVVRFHPALGRLAADEEAVRGQRVLGWQVRIGPDGTVAEARTMRYQDRLQAWAITASGVLPPILRPQVTDTTAYDTWLALLRPHAPTD